MMTLAIALGLALSQDAPPANEALAWLKSLDANAGSAQKKPRFPALTLEDLKTMKEIKLGGHRASDNKHVFIPAAEFRFLLALPALETANLVEIDGLTDESLVYVGKIPGLKALNLGDAQVSDAGLKHLGGLASLESLDLGWTKDVGDAGLPLLAGLPRLKILGLGGTKVTDAGLPALAACASLRELRLPATAVTDQGLAALEACKGLETLKLGRKSKATPQGIDRLKKALPSCSVSTQ
ncbi:MAG: hypothetical protein HY293_05370 [Planctomycetes bacterium]|nr:hypothetical protein [Planctomycetota bacterium]